MSVLEIPSMNTFVHFPLRVPSLSKAWHKRGASCDTGLRASNQIPKQAVKLTGFPLPCVSDSTATEEGTQIGARLRGCARWRSARQRSGRSKWQKPIACQTEDVDVSDVETAVPSPDASPCPSPDPSPCPSSAGSPLQTPSPPPFLRDRLFELSLPTCDGQQYDVLTGERGGAQPAYRDVPPCVAQNVFGNIVADREGSYAAILDPSSFDLVLQTPSPVLPTWQPPWAHALTFRSAAAIEANVESDDDTCSTLSDDSEDFFGCSCQCGDGRRTHVPFASFLGSDEIDEDFCPSCCSHHSCSCAPETSSPEPKRRSPCAVYDSPGEAFWR